GLPPFTPACHESLARAKRPFFSSSDFSPMYQTFPSLSCAYQSNVRSIGFPCSDTVSRTTVHLIPSTRLVRCVTTMSSVCAVPSLVPRKWNAVPGTSGKYGLSIFPTKSAGSIVGEYGPRRAQRGGRGEAADAPTVAVTSAASTSETITTAVEFLGFAVIPI